MARSCSICTRPDAGALNEALRSGRSGRSVALEFGVGDDAVLRHARHHLAREPKARTSPLPVAGDPLGELVAALRGRALDGVPSLAREYRLALQAQADRRHAAAPQRDLASEPEWAALRTALLGALEPFPEARQAVAAALRMRRLDG